MIRIGETYRLSNDCNDVARGRLVVVEEESSPGVWTCHYVDTGSQCFGLTEDVLLQVNHYVTPGIPESWEAIEALQASWPAEIRWHVGNVLKYVFRLGRKQGASVESDLEKIRNYADRAIKVLGKAK